MRGGLLVLAIVGLASPGAARPVVLELFTSQGCSSCPPADALLTEFARTRPDLLPLAFHVTYWNNLGWRDRWSFDGATERQQDYQVTLGRQEIYTPQLVINGAADAEGADRAGVEMAIGAASRGSGAGLSVRRSGRGIAVMLAGGAPATVWLVGFDRVRETPVGRGENSGRTLTESNVVRSLRALGDWDGMPARIDAALPEGEAAAVLVQDGRGWIVDAARVPDGR